jgi:hypothetical protein
MEGSDNRLKVIPGGCDPKPFARRTRHEAEQWVCRTCEADIGVATSALVEATLSPMVRDAKIEGGTLAKVCACCLARGKVTRAT